jgi:hypothetical protein
MRAVTDMDFQIGDPPIRPAIEEMLAGDRLAGAQGTRDRILAGRVRLPILVHAAIGIQGQNRPGMLGALAQHAGGFDTPQHDPSVRRLDNDGRTRDLAEDFGKPGFGGLRRVDFAAQIMCRPQHDRRGGGHQQHRQL